jgi:SAM-dependent methyltransferase
MNISTTGVRLTDPDVAALRSTITAEIAKAAGVGTSPASAVHEPLDRLAAVRFIAGQLVTLYRDAIRTALTTGTLGRLQRRLRGRPPRPDRPEEYWPVGPHLLWNWYEETHPPVIAYDRERKRLVRQDLPSYQQRLSAEIEQFMRRTAPNSVLELGCGYGRNIIRLRKAGVRIQRYFGLDHSRVAILSSIANLENEFGAVESDQSTYDLIVGDFTSTGLPDKSVDATFSVWSLPYGCATSPVAMEHIAAELVRVTRKSALLIEPDLSRRFGVRSMRGYWDVDQFCDILRSKGCRVESRQFPVRINWRIPLRVINAEMP